MLRIRRGDGIAKRHSSSRLPQAQRTGHLCARQRLLEPQLDLRDDPVGPIPHHDGVEAELRALVLARERSRRIAAHEARRPERPVHLGPSRPTGHDAKERRRLGSPADAHRAQPLRHRRLGHLRHGHRRRGPRLGWSLRRGSWTLRHVQGIAHHARHALAGRRRPWGSVRRQCGNRRLRRGRGRQRFRHRQRRRVAGDNEPDLTNHLACHVEQHAIGIVAGGPSVAPRCEVGMAVGRARLAPQIEEQRGQIERQLLGGVESGLPHNVLCVVVEDDPGQTAPLGLKGLDGRPRARNRLAEALVHLGTPASSWRDPLERRPPHRAGPQRRHTRHRRAPVEPPHFHRGLLAMSHVAPAPQQPIVAAPAALVNDHHLSLFSKQTHTAPLRTPPMQALLKAIIGQGVSHWPFPINCELYISR